MVDASLDAQSGLTDARADAQSDDAWPACVGGVLSRIRDEVAALAASRTSRTEVRLCVVHGGGHVVPQPVARARRFLGKGTGAINSIEEAWSFFARQPPLPHPATETPPAP